MGFGPQNQPAPVSLVGTPDDYWNRQYGQVPPVLAASNIPAVSATTGGVAASCNSQMSNGLIGSVSIFPGSAPQAAGSVALTFPSAPPTLFIAPEEGLGPVTQATVGNVVTISWTAASMIAGRSKPYNIGYQPVTSR